MKTIYIDVLIVLNIYVNFFLIRATSAFTHIPLKTIRCVVSSVIGSFFSLTILLPLNNLFINMIIKILAAGIITAVAFGFENKRDFLRLLIYFFIINFVFAGVVGFLYNVFSPSFMTFKNTYFYIDFSLISLVIFTAAAYVVVILVRRLMDKGTDSMKKYSITIVYKERIIKTKAIADTGNSLTDVFTGKPVIICPQSILEIEGDVNSHINNNGFRVIPYSTIGNTGLIPIFSPDEITVNDEETRKKIKVDALVGVISKDTPAIFNPKLIL